MKTKKIPTYHGSHPILGCLPDFQKCTIKFLAHAHQKCGDAVRMRFLCLYGYSFRHPEDVEYLYLKNPGNYEKETRGHKVIRAVTGNGIFTSEGDLWRRQRKSSQECVKQEFMPMMTASITKILSDLLEEWEDVQDLNINLHMAIFAFFCFDRACFGLGIDRPKVQEIIQKQDFLSSYLSYRARTPLYLPSWVPTRENRYYLRIKREVNHFFQSMIDEHRSTYKEERTLLGRIMRDNTKEDGSLDEEMIRDETCSFFAIGNETVGISMQWLFYVIGQREEFLNPLLEEIDSVVGSETPTMEHFKKMPYLDALLKEVLRMYPPVFIVGRTSIEPDNVNGYEVHKNHPVVACMYLIHRHPDFWEHPDEFRPERFIKKDVKDRHPFSYMPFGRGPHQCTGNHLATAEMKCMTTMILQRYLPVSVNPQQADIKTLFTLFSKDPIYIKWKKRA